jgi:hypothetical protein
MCRKYNAIAWFYADLWTLKHEWFLMDMPMSRRGGEFDRWFMAIFQQMRYKTQ